MRYGRWCPYPFSLESRTSSRTSSIATKSRQQCITHRSMEDAAISAANAPQSAGPHGEPVRRLIFRFVTIRTITCSSQSFRRYAGASRILLLLRARCSAIASTLEVGKRSMPQHRGEASLLITTQCFTHLLCRSMATKPFLSELPQPILDPSNQAAGSCNRILTE